MKYNWQQPDWPDFKYSTKDLEPLLYKFSERAGRIDGILKGLPEETQYNTLIELLVAEAIKTSAIEGEFLSRNDVMSSIKNNLGLNIPEEPVKDKRAQGISELMIYAQKSFREPLTQDSLFKWHKMLMKGNHNIESGVWRSHTEPMQIVSGAMGKEIIHFEAPPSARIPKEMKDFLKWFNATALEKEKVITQPIIRAAIAHLYFESIHPFEDGNGRIGRAISEKALSQYFARPVLLSLSKAMEASKKDYYNALKRGQRSNEITDWIFYFVSISLEAQKDTEGLLQFILKKTKFFDRHKGVLNNRQTKLVKRMLEAGPQGFEGGINTRKYVSLTRTSRATATRDLQDLLEKEVLIRIGKGRSTRYDLNI
ncbi:Fic family protein [Salegentibacter holothuriorum]|uniref:Fic family protein n=1 Tax=Salegentibacter holothuriorum TaxID=241145 RepID=A0A1T5DY41_9FLAO|nr:Fic family protein [Salegentibacter holothuriorum]SKB76742.1 Fic family protein [Salegentibacter holothuriorum]